VIANSHYPPTRQLASASAVIVLLLFGPPSAGAATDSMEDYKAKMQLITDTADKICNVIQTVGSAEGSQVQGQIKAELGGLASKLANVGVSGSGTINNENYQNVLRSDLSATLKDNAACKLTVFEKLQETLLPQQSHTTPQPTVAPDPGPHRSFRAADYVGLWKNPDVQTSTIPELVVRPGGKGLLVQIWGKCHPTNCDWGSVPAIPMGQSVAVPADQEALALTATFNPGFAEQHVTLRLLDQDLLVATTDTHFRDKSGRADYESEVRLSRSQP
jgi:hypothetical protein